MYSLTLSIQLHMQYMLQACNAVIFALFLCSGSIEKGVVVGRLTFREDGDLIDCQRMGVGGKAIPPNVDKVHVCCFAITSVILGRGSIFTQDWAMQRI